MGLGATEARAGLPGARAAEHKHVEHHGAGMRGTAKAWGRRVFSVNEARGSVLTKGSRNDRDRKSEKEKEGKKSRKKRKEDKDIIGISPFCLP